MSIEEVKEQGQDTRRASRRALWPLRRFARDESGAATIEFAILFPVFIAVLLAAFELGVYMTRQVMLDRSTDLVVRALRLGQFDTEDTNFQELLRRNVCTRASIIPDCAQNLIIEMTPISTTSFSIPNTPPKCVERDEDGNIKPVTDLLFNPGAPNNLMLVRVCAQLKPMFPTTYLGLQMPGDGEYYSLVTAAAFVNEPDGD